MDRKPIERVKELLGPYEERIKRVYGDPEIGEALSIALTWPPYARYCLGAPEAIPEVRQVAARVLRELHPSPKI